MFGLASPPLSKFGDSWFGDGRVAAAMPSPQSVRRNVGRRGGTACFLFIRVPDFGKHTHTLAFPFVVCLPRSFRVFFFFAKCGKLNVDVYVFVQAVRSTTAVPESDGRAHDSCCRALHRRVVHRVPLLVSKKSTRGVEGPPPASRVVMVIIRVSADGIKKSCRKSEYSFTLSDAHLSQPKTQRISSFCRCHRPPPPLRAPHHHYRHHRPHTSNLRCAPFTLSALSPPQ